MPPANSPPSPRSGVAHDAAVLALACLIAGLGSILAGQDANWDLRNYHLYNPWAWLTGRYGFDLAPAQAQTFHNPLLDVPFYAMVAADWPPRAIAFAMGLPAGVGAFFLWKITGVLMANAEPTLRRLGTTAALAIGLTGVNAVALLGLTMNEWPGTALVMASLWLVVREKASRYDARPHALAIAGLLTGLASGLKLTAATYAVGIAIALLLRRPPRRALLDTFAFGSAVLIGVAVTAGPWMMLLQEHYGSPLFPYFNDWFGSPLLPAESIRDRRFGPGTAWGWLSFPIDLLRQPAGLVGEIGFRDARFPVVALLAIIALLRSVVIRKETTSSPARPRLDEPRRFLIVFFAASLVVWAALHTIYRYLLPLELLTGLAIVLLLPAVGRPRWHAAVLVTLTIAILATTRYPDWGHTRFGERFLTVERPPIEANALVLLTADEPMSWVLVRFPADARHVGIESNLVRSHQDTGLRARAAAIIASHAGPIYQLTVPQKPAEETLARYGLARVEAGCAEVRGNLAKHPLLLCRLARVPA